jgi:hypothetical protein
MAKEKEQYQPQVGDQVQLMFTESGRSYLRKTHRHVGEIEEIIKHNGITLYKVRHGAPWASTAGWYARHRFVRV